MGHRALDWGVSEVSERARGMLKKMDLWQPGCRGEAGRQAERERDCGSPSAWQCNFRFGSRKDNSRASVFAAAF